MWCSRGPSPPVKRDVVDGLLAVQPGRVHGALVIGDRLRHPEAETGVVGVRRGDVRDDDVEVVQPGDGVAGMQVVTLGEPLGVLGVVEELDREAERVGDAHGLADAPGRTRRHPPGVHTELPEVALGRVHLLRPADAVGEPAERRRVTAAQHEAVVQVLLEGPQVERVGLLGGDDEPEHVDVEPPGGGEVGHDQLGVAGADDVGRGGPSSVDRPFIGRLRTAGCARRRARRARSARRCRSRCCGARPRGRRRSPSPRRRGCAGRARCGS